ncbi:MAG: hypothetical protein CSB48_13730 [Proteobacteria bacterium]|nr:MAG: hypothetical protein CSB48_13730 [Pseudomonadota bacterium]
MQVSQHDRRYRRTAQRGETLIAPGTGILNKAARHIQAVLDRAVSKAPSSLPQLQALDGKSLAIHTPVATVCLQVETGNIKLLHEPVNAPDVTLSATPITLIRLALSDNKQAMLQSPRVTVSGNRDDLELWYELFHRLNIDWEAVVAEQTGDIPAHFIGKNIREGVKWGKTVNTSLLANIEEYLLEEARLLPTTSEFNHTFSQVDNLQLTVDQLDARLSRLEKKLKQKPVIPADNQE